MKFVATPLAGVWLVAPEPIADERGLFARTFCAREFAAQGLDPRLVQCSTSFNRRKGTLRGLHYQVPPHAEAKLVRVTRGAIFDVAVDLRPGSPTRHRWHGVELSADNRLGLYIPEGCAHGFQTLCDDTEVLYQMSAFHAPDAARGVRWDDPALAIRWPDPEHPILSERDRGLPQVVGS